MKENDQQIMEYIEKYRRLDNIVYNRLGEIAAITNAHITQASPDNQLPLIDFLEIKTLADMTGLIREQHDLVLQLATQFLKDSELDELSSTVVYYYLFRAKLISGDYSRERLREFFELTAKSDKTIDYNVEKILKARSRYAASEDKTGDTAVI